MEYKLLTLLSILAILSTLLTGCLEETPETTHIPPTLVIEYPQPNQIVSQLIMISGTATDENNNEDIQYIEIQINNNSWEKADGTQFHPAIHISNLVITKLTKEKKMDPWRAKIIERKALYGFYGEELTGPKKNKKEENRYD